HLNLALLSFPDDAELKSLESEIHQRIQHNQDFNRLIAQGEEHVRLLDWESAVHAFASARQLDPGNSFVRKRSAQVLATWARDLAAKDTNAAAKLAQESLSLDSDNLEARELDATL